MYKELLAAAAIVLTFVAFVPYVRSILAGQTKPHAFSWIVWGLGTFVVFLAQLADRGGLGAWPTGVSGIITACIAVLAYRGRSDTSITKVDWVFLVIALAALPCWLLTLQPASRRRASDRDGPGRIRSDVPLRVPPSARGAHRLLFARRSAQRRRHRRAGALLVDDRPVPRGRRHRVRSVRRDGCVSTGSTPRSTRAQRRGL